MKTLHACAEAGSSRAAFAGSWTILSSILAIAAIQVSAIGAPIAEKPDTKPKQAPTPERGPTKPIPEISKEYPSKPENSKLLIFKSNETLATANTNLGGEFPPQLGNFAFVKGTFSLQWSRANSGKEEKGSVYLTAMNSKNWITFKGVTMPADRKTVNIGFELSPKLPDESYQLIVVSDTGSSSKVQIFNAAKTLKPPADVVVKPSGKKARP
jgi:hypothetical protein